MRRSLFLTLLILAASGTTTAQRLPDNVIPDTYDLKFTPDLASATFAGEETIHARLQKAATSVVLNSAEIEIKEAWIGTADFKQAATVAADDKAETATFTVPTAVPAGPIEIRLRFNGVLNDKLRGFYLSQTARRRYAVTQFEATDARRAFPCFDEPAYKAVFRVSLVVDKGDTAISNGKIISDTPGPTDGKHTLKFSDAPKMSTYLVAMMVGDFACIEGGADGIPIRVCAVPEKKNLLSFALLAAENNLKFYDTYYQTKYPFQKLDVIAFPDFAAGAMENTAAITYREVLLAIDDKNAPVQSHKAVVSVLAHEMAHMWFGDLVTMKWWDDIWLNEGFATWMADKPLEAWKPEWHGERFEIQETDGALDTDSIASVRPIRTRAETRADIETLFDGVAYGKAAAVLRMVEAYLGPEVFRKGVNAYLEKHAYGNAAAEDFWNQMSAASGKPIDQIMPGFTQQPGAPLIGVKTACTEKKEKKKQLMISHQVSHWTTHVTLAQQRYFADASKLDSGSPELWQVPVNLRPAGAKEGTYVLLTGRAQTFDLPGCAPWVYANAGGRGYYRSDYEQAALAKMSAELETSFSPEERIHFLADEWAMVRVGRLNIGDYLDSVQKVQSDRTWAVPDEVMSHFGQIHDNIVDAADRPAFEKWVRDFLRPIATDLGENAVPSEPDDKGILRTEVLAALATYGRDPQLIARYRAIVDKYMADPGSVPSILAVVALNVSALQGNADLYDKYMLHLRSAKTQEEYYNYFGALGAFPSGDLAKRTIEFALTPEVKSQDIGLVTGPVSNVETQAAAWEAFKSHFGEINTKAGTSLSGGLVPIAGAFCDEKLRDDAQDFLASQNIPSSERLLQNAKDAVNACIDLRSRQRGNLSAYLRKLPLNTPGANH